MALFTLSCKEMYGRKGVLVSWRNKNAEFAIGFVRIYFQKSVEVGQNLDTVAAVKILNYICHRYGIFQHRHKYMHLSLAGMLPQENFSNYLLREYY